jgi:hypothetical protein
VETPDTIITTCGSTPDVSAINDFPECSACPFCLDASQHMYCSGAGTCINDACKCDPGFTGAVCNVPESVCASGVLSENGSCCESGVVEASGRCCDLGAVLDASRQCCSLPMVLDACGVCGGSGLVVARDGECCKVGAW